MPQVPKADSIGKWLRRHGLLDVYALERIQRHLLAGFLKGRDEMTLDIDASLIFNQKSIAESTYKGAPGFSSMLGHLDGEWLVHGELRTRNIAPGSDNLAFVQRCLAQIPEGRKIRFLLADAASYQHELFDY